MILLTLLLCLIVTPCFAITQSSGNTLSDGLVAYYRFDDGGATTAVRENSNTHNGTASGNVDTLDVQGKVATAFEFNGVGEYIVVPDDDTLDFTEQMSFAFWFYRVADSGGSERIMSKSKDDGGADTYDYFVQINATDKLQIGVKKGDNSVAITSIPDNILVGRWYHAVLTKDSVKFDIYMDGVNVVSGVSSGTMGDARATATYNLQFARFGFGGGWLYGFNGWMDEFRLWNRTLTATEARVLYNGGIATDRGHGKRSTSIRSGVSFKRR